MRKHTAAAAVIAAALGGLVLAGCSSTHSIAPAPTTAQVAPHQAPAQQPNGSAALPLPFGSTVHLEGVDLSIGSPSVYTPTQEDLDTYKDSGEPITNTLLQVDFSATNNTNQAIQIGPDLTIQGISDNGSADEWVGTTDDSLGEPDAPLLPGHTYTWTGAYEDSGSSLVLTVSRGQSSVYVGGLLG